MDPKGPAAAEFDHIARIRSQAASTSSSFIGLGVGDDCALLVPSPGEQLAITSDVLIENVHFRRHWIDPFTLGRKALRVNLSDLAAMGADARACLLVLGMPAALADEWVPLLVDGLLEEARHHQVSLAGGDLAAASELSVGITAIGSVTGQALRRDGARPGDIIGLIGALGWARWGLDLLESRSSEGAQPQVQGAPESQLEARAIQAHLLPEVLLAEGSRLRQAGVRCGIDVSDGLAQDLRHVLIASGVGAEIDLEAVLTLAPPEAVPDRDRLALDGGEDYALLFTTPRSIAEKLSVDWTEIGSIVEDPAGIRVRHGQEVFLYDGSGYDHYK